MLRSHSLSNENQINEGGTTGEKKKKRNAHFPKEKKKKGDAWAWLSNFLTGERDAHLRERGRGEKRKSRRHEEGGGGDGVDGDLGYATKGGLAAAHTQKGGRERSRLVQERRGHERISKW